MPEPIKIILADDHPIVRQGLKQAIEADASLQVVAEAGDGQTALDLIEQNKPDVAVLDIDMPVMKGFEIVRQMKNRKIESAVIFLTMHDEKNIFQAALDLGVKGYILKDSALSEIVNGIKAVAENRSFISSSLSHLLLNRIRRNDEFENETVGLDQLTNTERRILRLIADEKTSKQIGEELYISYRTVEKHRTNISRKLNLQGSLALVKFAIAHKSEL